MQAKECRHFLFVLFLALHVSALQACGAVRTRNAWHGTIDMSCTKGNSISRLDSYHEDKYEDRRWLHECQVNCAAKYCTYHKNLHHHDWKLYFICPYGGFITRMYSNTYRTLYKDRKFEFTCCRKHLWSTTHKDCKWSGWQNKYDGAFNFRVESGYYLAGVDSRHYNWAEDRIWDFYMCKNGS